MDYTTVLAKAAQTLAQRKDRSAWDKGVTVYALELVEQLADAARGGYIDANDLMAPRMLRCAGFSSREGVPDCYLSCY